MPSSPPRPNIPKLSAIDHVIQTARLVLRPWTDADVDAIWPVVSDPEFPRQMSWTAHRDRAETLAWLQDRTGNDLIAWAIEHEGMAVGSITLDDVCWKLRAWRVDRAELGYWLAPSRWRSGLMTEAAHAVVRHAFDVIGLHKITVGCFADNIASRRVIEKVGFRFVGRLEDDVWRDGKWHAHLRYELTAQEWPDVHTTTRVQRPGTIPGR
jgi:RimJ/RimL family protein N-acetyltransferase